MTQKKKIEDSKKQDENENILKKNDDFIEKIIEQDNEDEDSKREHENKLDDKYINKKEPNQVLGSSKRIKKIRIKKI
jgi:hypothetical protein